MPGRVVRKFLIERQLVEEVVPQHVPQRDPLVRIVVEHPGKNKFDNFQISGIQLSCQPG